MKKMYATAGFKGRLLDSVFFILSKLRNQGPLHRTESSQGCSL